MVEPRCPLGTTTAVEASAVRDRDSMVSAAVFLRYALGDSFQRTDEVSLPLPFGDGRWLSGRRRTYKSASPAPSGKTQIVGLNVGDVFQPDGTPRQRVTVRRGLAKNRGAGDALLPDRLRPKPERM